MTSACWGAKINYRTDALNFLVRNKNGSHFPFHLELASSFCGINCNSVLIPRCYSLLCGRVISAYAFPSPKTKGWHIKIVDFSFHHQKRISTVVFCWKSKHSAPGMYIACHATRDYFFLSFRADGKQITNILRSTKLNLGRWPKGLSNTVFAHTLCRH